MNYSDLKILVLGKGKTGVSTADFLKKKNANVILVDEMEDGPFMDIPVEDFDLVVQSPGISRQHPFLKKCDELGIKVTNEIEIAYQFTKEPIIGVTGTNGKTTIVNLIDFIFKTCKKNSALVGNVGKPFIDCVLDDYDAYVLELSSYQLETIEKFRPKIAIISNLTPDHLERHKTMENYLSIKSNIYKNMALDDYLILNYDDKYLNMLDHKNVKTYYYSLKSKVDGIYLNDGKIILNIGKPIEILSSDELKIIGQHNIENAMAGILAAVLYGCSIECITKGIKEFKGVVHRLEYIRDIAGVKYYNDSKATNPEASIIGIQAFYGKNVYGIFGGSEKEVSYLNLARCIKENNVFAILQGDTKDAIASALQEVSYSRFIKLVNLKDALNFAKDNAKSGDVVLLSPACASFDQFDNFEHRGDVFKKYVEEI